LDVSLKLGGGQEPTGPGGRRREGEGASTGCGARLFIKWVRAYGDAASVSLFHFFLDFGWVFFCFSSPFSSVLFGNENGHRTIAFDVSQCI
jgi:hypothetical protein